MLMFLINPEKYRGDTKKLKIAIDYYINKLQLHFMQDRYTN